MNYAKAAVSLEKCRNLFLDVNRQDDCHGINEINQTISAMINYICNPDDNRSEYLDNQIAIFKKRFSEKNDG